MTSFVVGEAGRIVALWIVNLSVLWLADLWVRKSEFGAEASRKVIHVAAGAVAVPLPWILRSNVSMAVLAGGAVLGLTLCRRRGLLGSVHRVSRSSLGDLMFPIGVALLFFVGHAEPMMYLIGLMYMVLSDAAAAVIGRRYGRATYEVEHQRRSVEGSVTFFFVSFLAAHVILLLGTDVSRIGTVLVAAQLALLVTCFEAISLRGNDNLFVAAVTCLLVMQLRDLAPEVLARDLALQLTIGGLVAYVVWRTSFAGATGAITLGLFVYGAYALGGLVWLAAPFLVVGTYIFLRSRYWRGAPSSDRHFQVIAVFYVVAVGAALYLSAAILDVTGVGWSGGSAVEAFLLPYLGAAAGQLAILIYALWRPWDDPGETLDPGLVPSLLAAPVLVPLALLVPGGVRAPLIWVIATPFLALWLYRRGRRSSLWPRSSTWHSRLQAGSVLGAILIMAPIHLGLFGR